MYRNIFRILFVVVIAFLLTGYYQFNEQAQALAPGELSCGAVQGLQVDRIEVGKVLTVDFRSMPVQDGWTHTLVYPGARFLRVHFMEFQLMDGDKLIISSLDGSQTWEYTGRGVNQDGDFWSFATHGEAVRLQLAAPSGNTYTLYIPEVGFGTLDLDAPQPVPNVVCGTDGREAVACHTNEAVVNAAQKPVARLLYTSGRSQYLCTGELIRGSNANTLITNAHCIDTQTELNTLEARFNYQYTSCGGTTLGTTTSFAGGTLLKVSAERYNKKNSTSGLDFSLVTLQGNPEATFGELIPTKSGFGVGTQLNFIQHPGGLPKQIGYWEDSAHTIRCKVDTMNASYGSAKPNSQMGYGCDSEGGSSGSTITRASDGKVIGLHHYGGVSSSPCLNSATMMNLICDAAGSLLQCDNN